MKEKLTSWRPSQPNCTCIQWPLLHCAEASAVHRDGQYLWHILCQNCFVFLKFKNAVKILSLRCVHDDVIKMQNDACSLWLMSAQIFPQAYWDQNIKVQKMYDPARNKTQRRRNTRWEMVWLPALHRCFLHKLLQFLTLAVLTVNVSLLLSAFVKLSLVMHRKKTVNCFRVVVQRYFIMPRDGLETHTCFVPYWH